MFPLTSQLSLASSRTSLSFAPQRESGRAWAASQPDRNADEGLTMMMTMNSDDRGANSGSGATRQMVEGHPKQTVQNSLANLKNQQNSLANVKNQPAATPEPNTTPSFENATKKPLGPNGETGAQRARRWDSDQKKFDASMHRIRAQIREWQRQRLFPHGAIVPASDNLPPVFPQPSPQPLSQPRSQTPSDDSSVCSMSVRSSIPAVHAECNFVEEIAIHRDTETGSVLGIEHAEQCASDSEEEADGVEDGYYEEDSDDEHDDPDYDGDEDWET
jgi:hypothetical protein